MERQPDLTSDPNRFAETTGRQLDLPNTPERFRRLVEGEDYSLVKVNEKVESDRDPREFLVFVDPSSGEEEREVQAPHWRTSSVEVDTSLKLQVPGREEWVERDIPHYYVDSKGVGFLKPTAEGIDLEDYDSWTRDQFGGEDDYIWNRVLGMISKQELFSGIIEKTNHLSEAGLRIEVYWAIAKLKQLPFKGEMRSIDELRELGVLPKTREFSPHMATRLLKSKNRIGEAADADDRREDIFRDAFDVFNRETIDDQLDLPQLDVENNEHQGVYFREFARRMGSNMAVLLNEGEIHFHMHSANITMAAEIVDIPTMERWVFTKRDPNFAKDYAGVRKGHIKDMRDTAYSLKKLLTGARRAKMSFDKDEIKQAFFEGFRSRFVPRRVEELQKTNPDNAARWMASIFDAVIMEGKRLPSIRPTKDVDNNVIETQWGIDFEKWQS